MKEPYISPKLHICAFAPQEKLSSLEIDCSLFSVNTYVNAAGSSTEQKPGDIFFPITPTP